MYRDRADRSGYAPRNSLSDRPPRRYGSYDDDRSRDLNSYQRRGSRSDFNRYGPADQLDYDNDGSRRPSRRPLPPQQDILASQQSSRKSRPSLIPKDFRDDDNDDDDDEEDLLEKALRESLAKQRAGQPRYAQRRSEPVKIERDTGDKGVTHKNEGIAERIPLSVEHKEELENGASGESKETSVDPGPSSRTTQSENNGDHEKTSEKLETSPDVKPQTLIAKSNEESDGYDPEDVAENDNPEEEVTSTKDLVAQAKPKAMTEEIKEPEETASDVVMKDATPETEASAPASALASASSSAPPPAVPATPSESPATKVDEDAKLEPVTVLSETIVSIPQPLESGKIKPLSDPEAVIFPLNRLEQRLWELKNHPRSEIHKRLPYMLKKPIKDLTEYPFYHDNFVIHKQGIKPLLAEKLSIIKSDTFSHKINLLREYAKREEDWNARCEDMENQLRDFYPPEENQDQEVAQDSTASNAASAPSTTAESRNSRRSRHGDSVRSEAEFLEILKNFEKEREDDPLFRAEQLAAEVPDMYLNPMEKAKTMVNLNNLVIDKKLWAQRILTDPIDNFTQREHELFCEGFLAHPKKFGRISAYMNHVRSAEECVLHYYKTKKQVTDFKQLMALKKRKGKGRGKGKRGRAKSAANTPNTETPAESGDELNLENFVPKEANDELYTETGRRRRAAAPVFDSEKKDETEERKRSLESTQGTDIAEDEKKGKKKQRAGRPAKKPTSSSDAVTVDAAAPSVHEALESNTVESGKTLTSSYWSVKDIGIFYSWLTQVGPDWNVIASKLGTKTPTMVRNYYQRNADSHGWRVMVADMEKKNQFDGSSSDATPESTQTAHQPQIHQQPQTQIQHQPPQVQQQVQQHYAPQRNPPLGFFTAPTNVPSNITYIQPPSQQHLPPLHQAAGSPQHYLPSLQPATVQQASPVKNETLPPSLPPTASFPNGYITPGTQPAFARSGSGSNESESRSNPFSITSLLNPPEERKPVPTFPVQGTFTPVLEKREFYSNYNAPQRNGNTLSSRVNILNDTTPSSTSADAVNPLDALATAAGQNDVKPQAMPVISGSSGPSFPGRSILNPSGGADSGKRSNLHNMLNNDGN